MCKVRTILSLLVMENTKKSKDTLVLAFLSVIGAEVGGCKKRSNLTENHNVAETKNVFCIH